MGTPELKTVLPAAATRRSSALLSSSASTAWGRVGGRACCSPSRDVGTPTHFQRALLRLAPAARR
eukprot:scaffold208062_cov35-Tisochrysis_lutea.AAC.1